MNKVIPIAAALSETETRSLFSPLAEARGLPGRVYADPDYWTIERQRLFRDDWFAIGCASDVPKPGDMMPITVAEWELVLVRGEDGEVRCFHNVCRHRGTKLVLAPKNARQIACGWHCWTYALDGELLRTPIIDGPRTMGHDQFDRSKLGLVEVRSAVWNDAVFVNIGGDARSFAEFSAPLDALFAEYGPSSYNYQHPERHEDMVLDINWKLYHEGGLEGYHIPFVHPALEQPERYRIDNDASTFTSLTGALSKYKRLGTLVGLPEDTLDLNVAASEALNQGARIPYTICFITPTLIFAIWPEAVILTLLRPISPTKTGVRRNLYFIGDKASAPQTEPARKKYLDIWEGVTREDADYSAGVQRLSVQRDEIGVQTRFSPHWEEAVHMFQRRIAQRAYGASADLTT